MDYISHFAIHHYIANNHEIVQKLIERHPHIKNLLLNWIKEMENYVGVDIYGTADYLLD